MDKRVKAFFLFVFLKNSCGALFSQLIQSADFYYLATLAHMLRSIWQVFVSCENLQQKLHSAIKVLR